ncbi:hypothetical protein FIA58_008065 [Flavobacterium jejuense]|uniref:Lipoprotein n=1 Tax=Flavobacterium jejuense TaxID=1544455 RepID=A0ABX0IRD0_9FLAO|nr:hypothetical protein [Flavobacterium jejuense]NHN25630.1 hypothetical protein [Flavobacterium jejuense]
MIKKIIFSLLLVLIFFNCQEKTKEAQKTYEQLEAAVLCDVLPQIIVKFISLKLPAPPPPNEDFEKHNDKSLSDEKMIESINKQRDSLRKLALEFHKIEIGLNTTMFPINKSEFDSISQKQIVLHSLKEREIKNNEIVKSTLKIKLLENDTIASMGEFIFDRNLSAMVSVTRVFFNKDKSKAFFKLYPFGCLPYTIEVVSEKKNGKWVSKEITKK